MVLRSTISAVTAFQLETFRELSFMDRPPVALMCHMSWPSPKKYFLVGSIFRHNLLMERLTPQLRTSLLNDRLMRRRPGQPPAVRRIGTLADFEAVLIEQFDLHLPAPLVAQLYERVPKGLDQFVLPTA